MRYQEKPDAILRNCEASGCKAEGIHPAPKQKFLKDTPRCADDHYWFCLSHVREYNLSWDFFRGMSTSQIERFQYDAMLGHRNTKKIHEQTSKKHFKFWDSAWQLDMGNINNKSKGSLTNNFSLEEKNAYALLGLKHTANAKEIKTRYKELVKLNHPDLNRDNPEAEESFKKINAAYKVILRRLKQE